jgi:hypothetical protein
METETYFKFLEIYTTRIKAYEKIIKEAESEEDKNQARAFIQMNLNCLEITANILKRRYENDNRFLQMP